MTGRIQFNRDQAFSRAQYQNLGVCTVVARLYSDDDIIAAVRCHSRVVFDAALLQVLQACGSGLLRLGTVVTDGTKLDADAFKIGSVRYDGAVALRRNLAADTPELRDRAVATDGKAQPNPQALPERLRTCRRPQLFRGWRHDDGDGEPISA